jgi:mRNA interferase MazF
MNRGEIWLVNFDPTIGAEIKKTRPAIIISSQPFNRLRRTVVVMPLSSAHRQTEFPLLVAIHSSGRPSVAVVDQLKAAAKERFLHKVGNVTAEELEQISDALAILLSIG